MTICKKNEKCVTLNSKFLCHRIKRETRWWWPLSLCYLRQQYAVFIHFFSLLFQNKFHWEEVLSKAFLTQTHLDIPLLGFWVSLTLLINQRGLQSGAGACASQSKHQHAPGVLFLLKWSWSARRCHCAELRAEQLLIPALFALECHVHIGAGHMRFWWSHCVCTVRPSDIFLSLF